MPGEAPPPLIYAIRWPILGRHFGQLALVLCILTLPPFAVALHGGEHTASLRYAALTLLLLGVGWPLSRIRGTEHIQLNEAMVVITLAFVLSPLLMSWPLAAAGLPFIDALFEAVSGVTTTGLTTLASVEAMPLGFRFTRAWMQWYGGLGFAVLAVALLAQHSQAWRKLMEPSPSGLVVSTLRLHARRVLGVYSVLTIAAATLIWAAGLAPFDAMTHAFAAVSTGGFSTFDHGLAGMPAPAAAIAAACLLGAISLPLYYFALRRGPRAILDDPEVRALFSMVLILAAVLSLWFAWHGMSLAMALGQGLFMAASAQTTSGFSTLEVAGLDDFAKGVLILAMLSGGCLGSTAGGIKLMRVLILLRLTQHLLRRAAAPEHAVVEPHLAGRRLDADEINRALLIIILFLALILLSWLAFLAYGHRPLDALFEVTSAAGTVGLSTGITTAGLPTPLKLVLCLDMLAGRLEIVALLVTLYPGTWIGRQRGG